MDQIISSENALKIINLFFVVVCVVEHQLQAAFQVSEIRFTDYAFKNERQNYLISLYLSASED